MFIPWSDEELELLRNSTHLTAKEILQELEPVSAKVGAYRTLNSLHKKARKLGVKINTAKHRRWEPEELKYLEKHYANTSKEVLAKRFNTNVKGIINAAFRYGISGNGERRVSATLGRPPKPAMIQATPWKKYLTQILAVGEWFENEDVEVEIRTNGELMAVFRADVPHYTDEPGTLYRRLLKEGRLQRTSFRVFNGDAPYSVSGGFNAMAVGQPVNYEY